MYRTAVTIIIFLITVLLFPTFVVIGSTDRSENIQKNFSDIEQHWSKDTVREAATKGYIDGYEDGNFHPDKVVTRAEFIKMLVLALKLDIQQGTAHAWYSPFSNAAVRASIHQWSDFTSGDWNSPITREEMARLAVRATEKENNTDPRKWMYIATKTGLITGLDYRGDLGQDDSTSRAQAVTIIERVLKVRNHEELQVDKHAVAQSEVYWHKTNMFTMWQNFISAGKGGFDPENFDVSKLTVETSDGVYKGEITGIYIIDMADPNDPFLPIIPYSIDDLYWTAGADRVQFPVREFNDSYLVYYTQTLDYNKDPENLGTPYYSSNGSIQLSLSGIGELNQVVNEIGNCCNTDHEQYERIVTHGSLEALQNINLKLDPDFDGRVGEGLNTKKIVRVPMKIIPKNIKEWSYFIVDASVSKRSSMPYSSRIYYKPISAQELYTSTKRIELK